MREFTDRVGRRWMVWAVHPTASERRHGAPDARPAPQHERRRQHVPRTRLRPEYAGGWLACETAGEKRRIAPIPTEWEALTDQALATLCEAATSVRPSRRLAE